MATSFHTNQVAIKLPSGKSFLVWLSHDVDRVYRTIFHSVYYAIKKIRKRHPSTEKKTENSYWNFDRILDIEEGFGVRSTFFFLNESIKPNILKPKTFILANRYKIDSPEIIKVIKKIDKKGWEVGLHGSYFSYERKDLLQQEKLTLESILGHSVDGTRQHYLNLSIPDTWEYQQSIGLKYDASFGSSRKIGYRDNIYYPFHPFKNSFTVFPITIMDVPLFNNTRSLDQIWNECLKLIDSAIEKKTILSLLWHTRVFNNNDYPGYSTIYERLIRECQKRNAHFCTGKDVFQYIE